MAKLEVSFLYERALPGLSYPCSDVTFPRPFVRVLLFQRSLNAGQFITLPVRTLASHATNLGPSRTSLGIIIEQGQQIKGQGHDALLSLIVTTLKSDIMTVSGKTFLQKKANLKAIAKKKQRKKQKKNKTAYQLYTNTHMIFKVFDRIRDFCIYSKTCLLRAVYRLW